MLSLGDVFSIDELQEWMTTAQKQVTTPLTYNAELKLTDWQLV
ncbi:Uncharacterised protein [Weissella viridescens]|uniref:Uncharacterized protein n=1 Tax=Weissella viridescens TaxID=1629 RepID=A0A380P139_WEIVI|nr:Uncharacterised protein [Weissella viridescens]